MHPQRQHRPLPWLGIGLALALVGGPLEAAHPRNALPPLAAGAKSTPLWSPPKHRSPRAAPEAVVTRVPLEPAAAPATPRFTRYHHNYLPQVGAPPLRFGVPPVQEIRGVAEITLPEPEPYTPLALPALPEDNPAVADTKDQEAKTATPTKPPQDAFGNGQGVIPGMGAEQIIQAYEGYLDAASQRGARVLVPFALPGLLQGGPQMQSAPPSGATYTSEP